LTAALDLALIGNGSIGALVTRRAEIVWACFPRFDGDPVFCSLLRGTAEPEHDGAFVVEMIGSSTIEQRYIPDTPIVVTRFFDETGAGVEVTDFAPRGAADGLIIAPRMLVRRIERIAGNPLIRVRLRPMENYGSQLIAPRPEYYASGSDAEHLLYSGQEMVLRLTADAPLEAIVNETPFALSDPVTLVLSMDDAVAPARARAGADLLDPTIAWWRDWAGSLTLPSAWRDPVVRAAITLKLNVADDTGAIIAAMTTSIPEARNSTRNWDYRYCWLRDAYFVADALYRLGDSETTARFVDFVTRIVSGAKDPRLAPMYTITGGPIPDERVVPQLAGYRGMGPVRVGNQAYLQTQHDVYGEAILAALPLFTDSILSGPDDVHLFERLELLGNEAANLFDKPDAGLWELRGVERVHTFSSVMCWAACDALARIAERLQLGDRAAHWRGLADHIHQVITQRSWNPDIGAFAAAMEGDTLDASLLLMHPLGFLPADDARYVSTVRAIGRDLRRGDFIYRYVEKDDFGEPENAFLVCTFWYVDALVAIGDRADARRLFEILLSCRNPHGLLAEHVDPKTREQWGNFIQTYSMAGIISSAIRLA
jgi:GH15 family glucan-1,4-alpha-glucosidase